MWPDRVSNPGPLTYESGALPTALSGQATSTEKTDESIYLFSVFMSALTSQTIYSGSSVAGTLMARLPRLFRTRA